MSRLTRYLVGLFWSNALLFAGVATVLIWLIQCLRVFDVVSVKGQSIFTLVGQAVLSMPPLLIVFLYVCLGIGMGRALRDGYRNKVFLMTKLDGRTRAAVTGQLEQSLKRLQTDHIDLVQIHEVIRDSDPKRCFTEGNSKPYAACSRSNHAAPSPATARPFDNTSSVAIIFPSSAMLRYVTPVTSAPSVALAVTPARKPSVVYASRMSSHSRPAWGIWMK